MRDYFAESNLPRAAALAAILTLMSVGRLVEGGKPLALFIPTTFAAMVFVSAAVTAWGRRAGMAGIATARRTFLRGATVAVALSLIALPIYAFWLDPVLRRGVLGATRSGMPELTYPSSLSGCISLLLWSAGFQVMFLQAAPMALFARLTGRASVSVVLCMAFRTYVTYRQVADAGMTEGLLPLAIAAVLTTGFGYIVFARFGLAPSMLLAAGLDLHVFLPAVAFVQPLTPGHG